MAERRVFPFLTDLDSRAQIKGSRDPLGIQRIWTRFGRHVVGNLTTVSDSIRDFTTVLLGYHLVGRVSEEDGPGRELHTFLRWEQLAAYARAYVHEERGFRGTERVWARLVDKERLTLSAEQQHQILSNQKVYGLWGLYTVPSRASGLLEGEPTRVSLAGTGLPVGVLSPADFVGMEYLRSLTNAGFRGGNALVELLRKSSVRISLDGAESRLVKAVARLLGPDLSPSERRFYRYFLLSGGPNDAVDGTRGMQAQYVQLIEEFFPDPNVPLSPPMLRALSRQAQLKGEEWRPLADRLERIRHCESVMAPASMLFGHILGYADQPVDLLLRNIRSAWGDDGLATINAEAFGALRIELADGVPEDGERWIRIAGAASEGRYADLVDLLIEQNRAVMSARGGAAWAERRDGRLVINMREEPARLPSRDSLPDLWTFPYFLSSPRRILHSLREPTDG